MRDQGQSATSEPRRPRPRFSLLTLLLLTTIAAMGVVIWRQAAEVVPMRQELRQLREESGVLTIDDPTKVHAIALRDLRSRRWVYRVYLPPGRNYFVACQINDLPLSGQVPEFKNPPSVSTTSFGKGTQTAIGLPPGEYLVTLEVFTKDSVGQYILNCRSTNSAARNNQLDSKGSRAFSVDGRWPAREGRFATGGVSKDMSVIAADEPFALLDHRVMGENVRSSDESTEGAMVWIEPVAK